MLNFWTNISWVSFLCAAGVHKLSLQRTRYKYCRLYRSAKWCQFLSLCSNLPLWRERSHGQYLNRQTWLTVFQKRKCYLLKQVTGQMWSGGRSWPTPTVEHSVENRLWHEFIKNTATPLLELILWYKPKKLLHKYLNNK